MNFREDIENREYQTLDVRAAKSGCSRGRTKSEEKCEYRTAFQRDRDRIIHSKSFRRLMHKTQVFLAPEGDHYRTRLTHTLEVAQVARTIARILNYNEDLTEAIALGHDLGHTPFGHNGEAVLNQIHLGGFKHRVQSLRVVDILESTPKRRGLNLTAEVRDGILNHSGPDFPMTLEGQIVRYSDRIAYINHDIDDAIRSGVLRGEELPEENIQVLGQSHSDRINNLIDDIVHASEGKDRIQLSEPFQQALDELRTFMFRNVYESAEVKREADLNKVEVVITQLYDYFLEHEGKLPEQYQRIAQEDGVQEAVKDYISGMTDRYAVSLYSDLFVPKFWNEH
ncbi:MAG: deoxyguanosinetriphosphate triphosphohydrolase [Eubacteriales bacterium]|nr:deoxyguanosinetriphosphate triphosphohydrolase [Eubacteriales bacterium]